MMVGVGSDKTILGAGVAAAASNGIGAVVEKYDGSVWTKTKQIPGTQLLMDAATGFGITVTSSELTVTVSTDGVNFTVVEGFSGLSQSAVVFANGALALTGSFLVKTAQVPQSVHGVGKSNIYIYIYIREKKNKNKR